MKKILLLMAVCCMVAFASAQLVPLSLVNGDWSAPGSKVQLTDTAGWSAIDGWTADGYGSSGASGVEGGAFGFSNGTGGLIFQTVSETIEAGRTYSLNFAALNSWYGGTIVGEIYYVDGFGARIVIDSVSVDVGQNGSSNYNRFVRIPSEVSFTALAGEAYIGKAIGVQFYHDSTLQDPRNAWQCWAGFDDVVLSIEDPRYASNPSPDDDDETIDPATTTELSWEIGKQIGNPTVADPDIKGHWLFLYEPYLGEPNMTSYAVSFVSDLVDPITEPISLGYNEDVFWQVEEAMDNGAGGYYAAGDPNNLAGPVWYFKTVQEAPAITAGPAGVLVAEGEDALFEVEYSSSSEPTFKWYLSDDMVADPFTDTLMATTSVPSYTKTAVSLTDAGKYVYCVISNLSAIEDASPVARLEVERLVAHWKMDDTLTDETDNHWDGTATAATSVFAGGKDGLALSLPASDPNYVAITGSEEAFNFFPLGMTVSCWVNTEGGPWGALVAKQNYEDSGEEGYILSGFVLAMRSQGDVIFNLRQLGQINSASTINDGAWHLITATYDGATGRSVLYIDGEESISNTYTATPLGANYPLLIGAERTDGTSPNPFVGLVDDVRIFNYAVDNLTALDLYNEMNATKKILCITEYADGADIANSQTGLVVGDEGFEPDCVINLDDFAEMAAGWLSSGLYPVIE